MSLVAYASSDDESTEEGDAKTNGFGENGTTNSYSGHISDDEFDLTDNTILLRNKTLKFPTSKHIDSVKQKQDDVCSEPRLLFDKLPAPKNNISSNIIEEDDEFLHKKAKPLAGEKPPPPPVFRGPVKIMVPSLADFKDLEDAPKKVIKPELMDKEKSCGLLGLLPKPKQEQVFNKNSTSECSKKRRLIPDSVRNSTAKPKVKKIENPLKFKETLVPDIGDSEDSDAENDFFSLNSEVKLPEVSTNEINAMVAKRAAKMAEVSSKINEIVTEDNKTNVEEDTETDEVLIDEKALQVLVGSRAKRQNVEEMQVVELSSEQVLPNKDEWLRTALASATTYQPRGVLVDEEPVPGTRKKHQITYLAHQAKANEQELQAMWAANRHTRRQTQSKYGF